MDPEKPPQQETRAVVDDTRTPTHPQADASKLQLVAAGFGFFIAGVNDGSIGPLVPYFIRDYGVNTAEVSAIHAANFLGWFAAALTNTHLCQYLDLGAMLTLGASLQLLAHSLRPWTPPFPLLVVTFWIVSLGQAQQDTLCNTFVAGIKNAHRWLAYLHSMYAAGCLCGPFISTAIAGAHTPSRWPLFYLCPIGLSVVNIIAISLAFRDTLRLRRNKGQGSETGPQEPTDGSRNDNAFRQIKAVLKLRPFWFLSLFFFFYLGAAITATGWIVEYLVVVRDGDLATMGYIPAGANGGTLLGRLFLAEPAHRFGERRVIFLYAILAIAFQLIFWLVPNIIAAAVAVSFLGAVMGPFFSVGVSVGSRLFDNEVRGTALGFLFVFAQMGGCLFPIITGVISLRAGVQVLQPILCALLVATALSWLLVPKPKTITAVNS